jgi:hypothetical protein
MFSVPFKEEDFYDDDSQFDEIWRHEYAVLWASKEVFAIADGTGEIDEIELEEVSEQDRPYVKKGSRVVEIYGRRSMRSGSKYRSSFWVVLEWPGKE